jgi:hypothetical protein
VKISHAFPDPRGVSGAGEREPVEGAIERVMVPREEEGEWRIEEFAAMRVRLKDFAIGRMGSVKRERISSAERREEERR